MAEQPMLPAWHAERYRRMSEHEPSLVTVIEATTPDNRDRAVDALRALAILGVVLGHWLVTAMVNTGGFLHVASPLTSIPALTPISWVFQTLSIFFLVGGYTAARSLRKRTTPPHDTAARNTNANANGPDGTDDAGAGASDTGDSGSGHSGSAGMSRTAAGGAGISAGRSGAGGSGTGAGGYRGWFGRRVRRLVTPVPILLGVWAAAVPLLLLAGYRTGTIVSLINLVLDPLWFLLVFTGLTALTPVVLKAVRRWGVWTAALPVAITALVDLARFGLGAPQWIGWITVASAWLVPFTLGVAWAQGAFTHQRDGINSQPGIRTAAAWVRGHLGPLALLIGGGAATITLVAFAGYPASMVGVPGQAVSNLSPPTLASVAFGLAQCGGALLLLGPLTRLMRRPVLWAGVALVNLSAMTVFLWHQSALLGVSALVTRITGTVPGLLDVPDHPGWIVHRLVWIPVFAAVLVGLWSLAHRFERRIRSQPTGRPVRLTKRPDVPEGTFGTRRTTTGCAEH